MTARIVISLDKAARYALGLLAEREYRSPRAQAAFLIRRELQEQGLLPVEEDNTAVDPPSTNESGFQATNGRAQEVSDDD
ncbi:MAG: hypothetical protein KJ063_23885 [Anaerolineae bacterium]|nr:hypothetical protein [Anaerolineae bacterium]